MRSTLIPAAIFAAALGAMFWLLTEPAVLRALGGA